MHVIFLLLPCSLPSSRVNLALYSFGHRTTLRISRSVCSLHDCQQLGEKNNKNPASVSSEISLLSLEDWLRLDGVRCALCRVLNKYLKTVLKCWINLTAVLLLINSVPTFSMSRLCLATIPLTYLHVPRRFSQTKASFDSAFLAGVTWHCFHGCLLRSVLWGPKDPAVCLEVAFLP